LAEESKTDELFSIDKISEEYKTDVKNIIELIDNFIHKNITQLESYYKEVTNIEGDKDIYIKLKNDVINEMRSELLPKLKNGIRCMLAVNETQYIEVAKEIDKNKFAVTLTLNTVDGVFWTNYLHFHQYGDTPNILDSHGVIKYTEWFYESNLKIRVVKQIRDEKGNYYGELYADYYKLDQYDKLFDEKGNPRKLKK
jgi:hypothetical protein